MADESKNIVASASGVDTREYVDFLALRRAEFLTNTLRRSDKAHAVLEAILDDPCATNRAKIDAAKALCEDRARIEDRVYGKAAQAVHVTAGRPGDAPAGLIFLPALEAEDE